MKRLYDTYTIYEFSDECIVKEICKRVKSIRPVSYTHLFLNDNIWNDELQEQLSNLADFHD